jgi:hypothetical protein
VRAARRDRDDVCEPADLHRQGVRRAGRIAHLAVRVIAPAPDGRISAHRAAELVPGRDRVEVRARWHFDRIESKPATGRQPHRDCAHAAHAGNLPQGRCGPAVDTRPIGAVQHGAQGCTRNPPSSTTWAYACSSPSGSCAMNRFWKRPTLIRISPSGRSASRAPSWVAVSRMPAPSSMTLTRVRSRRRRTPRNGSASAGSGSWVGGGDDVVGGEHDEAQAEQVARDG